MAVVARLDQDRDDDEGRPCHEHRSGKATPEQGEVRNRSYIEDFSDARTFILLRRRSGTRRPAGTAKPRVPHDREEEPRRIGTKGAIGLVACVVKTSVPRIPAVATATQWKVRTRRTEERKRRSRPLVRDRRTFELYREHCGLVPLLRYDVVRLASIRKGVGITGDATCGRHSTREGSGLRLVVALASIAALLATETNADFYLGAAIGGDRLPSMRLVSGDDDRASRCDEYINPRYAELPACTASDRSVGAADAWSSRFASAWGVETGVAVGYRFGKRFRVELEADYGSVGLDTSSPIIAPSGVPYDSVAIPELADAYERLGNAEFLGLFVTAYADIPNRTRFTPFVGIGAGVGFASMDYDVLWERTDNLDDVIYAGAGLPNEDEIRRNLVGGDTRASQRLRDRLGTTHITVGVAYALTERVSLEIRARHLRSSDFGDGGSYITLRGHPSELRRDGSEPVRWHVRTKDTNRSHVGFRLNYRL